LTYMSIRQYIGLLVKSEKLARVEAPPGLVGKRRLYLTETAVRDLADPTKPILFFRAEGQVRAAMLRWVLGLRVYGDAKGKNVFLKRLCPPPNDIWEMRITEPTPQIRFLGTFADKNTLVLMRAHTRAVLGDKGSAEWQHAMDACATDWAALFPNHSPHQGASIKDFVSENLDEYPICP
jgi:hypothetical protein